jgi:hypothetical protein
MLVGVATRQYARSLEPLGPEMEIRGTSKSAVSRPFVARTAAQLAVWQSAPFDGLELVALLIDGVHLGDYCLIVALGIAADGQKHALGLWDGSTENARVCQDLLANLQSRGLRTDRSLLVILDGSKALRKAVRAIFGEAALVQRCQVHIAGRDPRLPRGEMSPPGQVPMRPVVWGQTWRGNWPRRSRPDNVASVPSPEALTKSRAATKVNAFGAVNASWTSIAGRVQDQGGRVACVPTKTATTAETWGSEAVVPSAVEAAAREEGDVRERTRALAVDAGSAVVSGDIRRDPPKFCATLRGQSEEVIVATKAWTAEPAGAKDLYLSRAS